MSIAGWVTDQYTVLSKLTGFLRLTWTSDTVTFTVLSETTGKIQLGFLSENQGSGAHARVFIDDLMLWYQKPVETGIIETNKSITSVYPTLTNGNVKITFSEFPGTISLYNISGAKVFTKKAVLITEIYILGQMYHLKI